MTAGQDFACAADVIDAAEKLSTKMKWHQLEHIQTCLLYTSDAADE